MKFEVKRCGDGSFLAFLHSPDSCCHGAVTERQLREFASELLRVADGKLERADVFVPWEPEGL